MWGWGISPSPFLFVNLKENMMKNTNNMPEPVNVGERYLYGINVRLDALIEQVSSLLNYIATKDDVTVEKHITEISAVVESVVNDVEETVAPVKRTRKKKE